MNYEKCMWTSRHDYWSVALEGERSKIANHRKQNTHVCLCCGYQREICMNGKNSTSYKETNEYRKKLTKLYGITGNNVKERINWNELKVDWDALKNVERIIEWKRKRSLEWTKKKKCANIQMLNNSIDFNMHFTCQCVYCFEFA